MTPTINWLSLNPFNSGNLPKHSLLLSPISDDRSGQANHLGKVTRKRDIDKHESGQSTNNRIIGYNPDLSFSLRRKSRDYRNDTSIRNGRRNNGVEYRKLFK